MVKIKLNDNEKTVTMGAYREFYEHLGYKIVTKQEKPIKKEVEPKKDIKVENKDTKETYSRK